MGAPCPKCRFELEDSSLECPRCGIVLAHFTREEGQILGIEFSCSTPSPRGNRGLVSS